MDINCGMNDTQYTRQNVVCKIWTQDEIQQLLIAHEFYGNDWRIIQQKFFPNRTMNQLKCKYNYLMFKDVRKQRHIEKAKKEEQMIDNLLERVLQHIQTSSSK